MKTNIIFLSVVSSALLYSCGENQRKSLAGNESVENRSEEKPVLMTQRNDLQNAANHEEPPKVNSTNLKELEFGSELVPKPWFDQADQHIRLQLEQKKFVLQIVQTDRRKKSGSFLANDTMFRVGVLSADGKFTTWPGARAQPFSKWGDGFFVIGDPNNLSF